MKADISTTLQYLFVGVGQQGWACTFLPLESTDGLCKPVSDQESGNSFSYLEKGEILQAICRLAVGVLWASVGRLGS